MTKKKVLAEGEELGKAGRPVSVWSERGKLLEEMELVMRQGWKPNDTETMKQARKLFKEDFKGYLALLERMRKEEQERLRLELEVLKKREVVEQQEKVKKEAVSMGPQERTVEELIKSLVKALG